jgi:hypothetical protein
MPNISRATLLVLCFPITLSAKPTFAAGPNVIQNSRHDTFSSVYVAGRKPSDPLGSMSGPLILAVGSGVQFNSFKRWGDYSSMTVDPKDDCTFWFTQEYYVSTGSFNWATRIGSFKFDSCKPGGR